MEIWERPDRQRDLVLTDVLNPVSSVPRAYDHASPQCLSKTSTFDLVITDDGRVCRRCYFDRLLDRARHPLVFLSLRDPPRSDVCLVNLDSASSDDGFTLLQFNMFRHFRLPV